MRSIPAWRAFRAARAVFACAFAAALTLLPCTDLAAQKLPPAVQRWQKAGSDSVLIYCAMPETTVPRPAVIVLPDRFGMQPPLSNIVSVFALQGFRAYAIGLRSSPTRPAGGAPEVRIDSSDVGLVAQAVVDIVNEPGCTGTAGLFAFDAGAIIGALTARRLPLFKSCYLFYPPSPELVATVIPAIDVPVTVAYGDASDSTLIEAALGLKELALGRTRKLRVQIYRETGPFFFNQKHESFRKESMNAAWVDAIRVFRETL
jgi:dienelactone hydrolase